MGLLLSPSLWCLMTLSFIICTVKADIPWFGNPEKVHLSWHGDESEMWVKWVTLDIYPHLDEYNEYKVPRYTPGPYPVGANGSIVEFGETGYTRNSSGIPIQIDHSSKRIQYIHRARMTGLKPKTKYFYHVGSEGGWSEIFWFTTPPSGTDWSPSIADFGDFGNDDTGSSNAASKPEQVHLSWHGDATEMWVTWVTLTPVGVHGSVVEFGETGYTKNSSGTIQSFNAGSRKIRKIYIHRARMMGLKPKTKYYYRVGGQSGWSQMFWFKTLPSGTNWSPRIAVFADLGNENAVSLAPLQEETQKDNFDLLWHIGDFAYDLHYDDGLVGDQFMRQMQPLTAYVPYQVVVGNHEYTSDGLYNQYRARFTMPNYKDKGNLFYSYNAGPAHIIIYSTESYFFSTPLRTIRDQYRWLENDLKKAARSANRKNRPWIITLGHRPMYCSTYDPDCTKKTETVRVHDGRYGLEDLFCKYGVDLNIVGHEHSYERLWPVYNNKVYNGSTSSNPYDNPGAPVHIISGSAGCEAESDKMIAVSQRKKWSAFAQAGIGPSDITGGEIYRRGRGKKGSYGYGHLNILNKTAIYWEQVRTYPFSEIGTILDKLTLIKREDNHRYAVCKHKTK